MLNIPTLSDSTYMIINPDEDYTKKKFMTIDNGNLVLNTSVLLPYNHKPLSVLSIVGPARRGKSTLLNCIITNIIGTNYNVFQTSDTDEHCTYGIDYTVVQTEERNILFLDVQGLGLHDSSNDCKILLFTYLISDIIIFNERNIIDNRTLDTLLPLTTFMTYINESELIEKKKRPQIIFRISDCDLKIDSKQNLDKVLEHRNDQYQNVRESIKKLFSEIIAVRTESLDRKEKSFLLNENYAYFLDAKENNFRNVCITITDKINSCDKFTANDLYLPYVQKIIIDLNQNKKIDWDKLDITKHISKQEIGQWIEETVDKKYYVEEEVDGTIKCYTEILEPRKKYIEKTMYNFDKQFINATPMVRDTERQNLNQKLIKPYENMYDRFFDIACQKVLEQSYKLINTSFEGYIHIIKYEESNKTIGFLDDLYENINKDVEVNLYYWEAKNKIMNDIAHFIRAAIKDISEQEKKYHIEREEIINDITKYYQDELAKVWDVIKKNIYKINMPFNFFSEPICQKFKYDIEKNYQQKYSNYKLVFNKYSSIAKILFEETSNDYDEIPEKTQLIDKFNSEVNGLQKRFMEVRNRNLARYLENYQKENTVSSINDAKKIVTDVENGGCIVYFLDILPSVFYVNANHQTKIIAKYNFIKENVNIYEIQTKEDFQKKYPETVVKYYFKINKYMKPEEEDLRDIIKVKIIEIMFQYVLDM